MLWKLGAGIVPLGMRRGWNWRLGERWLGRWLRLADGIILLNLATVASEIGFRPGTLRFMLSHNAKPV